ncbi:Uncharacterized conserved protein, DUF934 family [Polaromonas sp. OV174]|uniref:DUF934 domain-containing protein n=1 Tax=Polaromonas sp. OV174 TaxID=1855300 RepID=UPI0008E8D91A|nr:DUF934 domain-containing protein [Polaromonas sp. OV174]SFC67388.1 Uncharacterized conserved protein, DUF934 family [Polaromonas sp. OV174]
MKLIAASAHLTGATSQDVIELANDADPFQLTFAGVDRIDLNFPKFTDGRAFSQAFLLRRRLGFKGEIRATGDVLVDQLAQMERSGFDVAVLRADQDLGIAQRVLAAYPGYGVGKYQGDAVDIQPHFAAAA